MCDPLIIIISGNLVNHLTFLKEKLENFIPKNGYQQRETLFLKHTLTRFSLLQCSEAPKKVGVVRFRINSCARRQILQKRHYNLDRANFFASFSINFIEKSIFLSNSIPKELVEYFADAIDRLGTQSTAQVKLKFFQTDINKKSKLNQVFSLLNQCRCHREPVRELEEGEEQYKPTNFAQTQ